MCFARELTELPISDTFLKYGTTLLHFVCHFPTEPIKEKVHQYELESLNKYREIVSRLLIQSGCDPNHLDTLGNTPLHIVITSLSEDTAPLSMYKVTEELIMSGSHLDTRNVADKAINWDTLEHAASVGGFMPLFNTIKILPLKCLSARKVAMSEFNFVTLSGILPKLLFEFVKIHSNH